MRKRSITNSANDFVSSFNNGKGFRIIVINKASDVLPGHFGKLLLEQGFQTGQDNKRARLLVVINCSYFDEPLS